MYIAVTRDVSPNIEHCELTHLDRKPIDLEKARDQHKAYRKCLAERGCTVNHLPAEPDLPDSVFVEDTAIVFDELAIITRPGAVSRRPETTPVADVLKDFRHLEYITAPGTIDGGDVLTVGNSVYIGLSKRTNQEG